MVSLSHAPPDCKWSGLRIPQMKSYQSTTNWVVSKLIFVTIALSYKYCHIFKDWNDLDAPSSDGRIVSRLLPHKWIVFFFTTFAHFFLRIFVFEEIYSLFDSSNCKQKDENACLVILLFFFSRHSMLHTISFSNIIKDLKLRRFSEAIMLWCAAVTINSVFIIILFFFFPFSQWFLCKLLVIGIKLFHSKIFICQLSWKIANFFKIFFGSIGF